VRAPFQIPEAVEKLIATRIRSVEELEVVLLLHAHAQRSWSVAEIAAELRTSASLVASALGRLKTTEVVIVDGERYQLAGPQTEALQELARCNREHRVEMLVLISAKAIERVRSEALRTFAEAFRFKAR
jgi:hypothetical protein